MFKNIESQIFKKESSPKENKESEEQITQQTIDDIINELFIEDKFFNWSKVESLPEGSKQKLVDKLTADRHYNLLAKNIEHLDGLDSSLVDIFIEKDSSTSVAAHPDKFVGVSQKEIMDKLLAAQEYDDIARCLYKFSDKDIDYEGLADKCVSFHKEYLRYFAKHMDKFGKVLDENKVANRMIKEGWDQDLASNLYKFKNLEKEIAYNLMDSGHIRNVLANQDSFADLGDNKELVDYLADKDYGPELIVNIDKLREKKKRNPSGPKVVVRKRGNPIGGSDDMERFLDVDTNKLFDQILARGLEKNNGDYNKVAEDLITKNHSELVLRFIDKFSGVDNQRIVMIIIERSNVDLAIRYLDKLKNIDYQEVADRIMSDELYVSNVIVNLEKFPGIDHQKVVDRAFTPPMSSIHLLVENIDKLNVDHNVVLERLLDAGFFKDVIKNIKKFSKIKDQALLRGIDDFGDYFTMELYEAYKKVLDGDIDKDAQEFGVKKEGTTGLNQLRNGVMEKMHSFVETGADEEKLLTNNVFISVLKAKTRFESAEFGLHEEDEYEKIIDNYLEAKENGEISPMSEYFESSGEIKISKVDKEVSDKFEYNEDFLSRYETLLNSIQGARKLFIEKKGSGINELVDNLKAKIKENISNIDNQLEILDNEKVKENLAEKKEELSKLLKGNFNPQEAFNTLMSFKKRYEEDLR